MKIVIVIVMMRTMRTEIATGVSVCGTDAMDRHWRKGNGAGFWSKVG